MREKEDLQIDEKNKVKLIQLEKEQEQLDL